ncbi:MAG: hypothetical protein ACI3Y0_04120 [Prevotella sp.]
MKKFFTYLFASAAFCMMGTVNAMAQEEEVVEDDLLPDMFMNWTDPENPVECGENDCAYVVGEQTGMPYGNGSVLHFLYADISDYDKLVVTVSSKAADHAFPRPFINRTEADQQATDVFDPSLPVDFNKDWAKERYMTEEGDADNGWTYTFDLNKIKEDYGFVHLHCIKVGGWSELTVDAMTLVKGGSSTGVNKVSVEKAFEGQCFNLAGQKVGKNAKGLVIMNGKIYVK